MNDHELRGGMLLDELLRSRRTVRAFLAEDVPVGMVEHLLDVARHAPSTFNTPAMAGARPARRCEA